MSMSSKQSFCNLPFEVVLSFTIPAQDGETLRKTIWTVLSILKGVADALKHIPALEGE